MKLLYLEDKLAQQLILHGKAHAFKRSAEYIKYQFFAGYLLVRHSKLDHSVFFFNFAKSFSYSQNRAITPQVSFLIVSIKAWAYQRLHVTWFHVDLLNTLYSAGLASYVLLSLVLCYQKNVLYSPGL